MGGKPSVRDLRRNRYAPRTCPDCKERVRTSATTAEGDYDWREPRRITQHFVKGKRCPGSGKVVRLVQEYHAHRLGPIVRQEVVAHG